MNVIDTSSRLPPLAGSVRAPAAVVGREAATPPAPGGAGELAPAAAARIAALDLHDPDRRRKAVRIYLECTLLQAFGAHLLRDPGFADMADAVHRQMEADIPLRETLEALGTALLAGALTA